MSNAFPGVCRDCDEAVPKGGGVIHRIERGRWTLRCMRCVRACNEARVDTYENWRAAWRKNRGI